MKITHIRIRRLKSGPGFNNYAVEAEAQIGEHESAEDVREHLTMWVDQQIERERQAGEMVTSLASLVRETKEMERARDAMRKVIDRGHEIIAAHGKLRDLAKAANLQIPGIGELGDDIPF